MPSLSENHRLCRLWCRVSGAAGGGGYRFLLSLFLTQTHTLTHSDCPHQRLSSARHRQHPTVFSPSKHALIVSALFLKQLVFFWPRVKAPVWDIWAGMKTSRVDAFINSVAMAVQWMTLHSAMNRHGYVSTWWSCMSGSEPAVWHTICCCLLLWVVFGAGRTQRQGMATGYFRRFTTVVCLNSVY